MLMGKSDRKTVNIFKHIKIPKTKGMRVLIGSHTDVLHHVNRVKFEM